MLQIFHFPLTQSFFFFFCLLYFFSQTSESFSILKGIICITVVSALSHHAGGNDFVVDWKQTGALSDSFSVAFGKVQPNPVFVLFFV